MDFVPFVNRISYSCVIKMVSNGVFKIWEFCEIHYMVAIYALVVF